MTRIILALVAFVSGLLIGLGVSNFHNSVVYEGKMQILLKNNNVYNGTGKIILKHNTFCLVDNKLKEVFFLVQKTQPDKDGKPVVVGADKTNQADTQVGKLLSLQNEVIISDGEISLFVPIR